MLCAANLSTLSQGVLGLKARDSVCVLDSSGKQPKIVPTFFLEKSGRFW